MYCPIRQAECLGEECAWFIVTNGIRLGCAISVQAKQQDKIAFQMKKNAYAAQEHREQEVLN